MPSAVEEVLTADDWRKRPARERLYEKIREFGDRALLRKDEACAYLECSERALEGYHLPFVDLASSGVGAPRILFGSLVATMKKRERAA